MEYDFIVIGAGIAGASIAYELSKTARVCVVERESHPGYHSTGRSAALFAPSYGGREFRALTRASAPFFDRPPAGFSEQPLLRARGCMYIAREDQRLQLAQMIRELRDSGGNITMLDAGAARSYVPLLKQGYAVEAALDNDAMDIEVDALHQGFLRGARAAGATLFNNAPVEQVERRADKWCVTLPEATATAPVLINAAGAWADQVAALCGADPVGLQPRRRTALLTEAPAGVDIRQWPAVIDADERFYFKPEAGKLLISPADETAVEPCDVQPEELDVAIGVDRVEAALDYQVNHVSHRWAGLRTFAQDRVPVVGFDARVPGFFWCAGQGGYGIQSAPAFARTAAALAQRLPLPQDVLNEGLIVDKILPHRFARRAVGSVSL